MRAARRSRRGSGSRPHADVSPRHAHRRSLTGRARRRPTPVPPGGRRPPGALLSLLTAWSRPGLRVLVLCVELAGAILLVASPAFAATSIDVSGVHHLTRDEVLRVTGLAHRGSVFLITPSRAEDALRSDPYVRGVTVRATLPNHVEVAIDEWEPVGLLHRAGHDYLLGSDGNVLGPAGGVTVGADPGRPKVELTWAAGGALAPGAHAISGRLLQDLQRMQDAFPGAYRLTVQSIELSADLQLTILTREGPRILFGQMVTGEQLDSLDTKLASLKALSGRVDLGHSKLEYINLMNPTAPVTRAIPSPSPSPRPSPSPKKP